MYRGDMKKDSEDLFDDFSPKLEYYRLDADQSHHYIRDRHWFIKRTSEYAVHEITSLVRHFFLSELLIYQSAG